MRMCCMSRLSLLLGFHLPLPRCLRGFDGSRFGGTCTVSVPKKPNTWDLKQKTLLQQQRTPITNSFYSTTTTTTTKTIKKVHSSISSINLHNKTLHITNTLHIYIVLYTPINAVPDRNNEELIICRTTGNILYHRCIPIARTQSGIAWNMTPYNVILLLLPTLQEVPKPQIKNSFLCVYKFMVPLMTISAAQTICSVELEPKLNTKAITLVGPKIK